MRCFEHGDESSGSIISGEFLDCLRKILLQAVGELVRPLAAAVKRRAESSFPRSGITSVNLIY